MGYEIDFFPVGDGERSGEAISLRLGNLFGNRDEQAVVIIDGGFQETGEKIIEHIETYYKTDIIDLVVSTHPDSDHSSGLSVVLENLKVRLLWMHQPWNHSSEIIDLLQDKRITETSWERRIQESLQDAHSLEDITKKRRIPIVEPFSDSGVGNNFFTILSPSTSFYEEQLANFRETLRSKEIKSFLEKALHIAGDVITKIAENWGVETLIDPDDDETSAENNSSVILLIKYDSKQFLFSGDAGALSLNEALNKANEIDIDLKSTTFYQVPHHGSKHNIGPSLLDEIVGPIINQDLKNKTAFVSAAESDEKHPSKRVTNAFRRRGAKVIATGGSLKRHHSSYSPDRGWEKAEPLPFYYEVED